MNFDWTATNRMNRKYKKSDKWRWELEFNTHVPSIELVMVGIFGKYQHEEYHIFTSLGILCAVGPTGSWGLRYTSIKDILYIASPTYETEQGRRESYSNRIARRMEARVIVEFREYKWRSWQRWRGDQNHNYYRNNAK